MRLPCGAEETGQRDTSAAERNAIRRALRREVSWRRRRGIVLAKTRLEQRLKVSEAAAVAAATAAAATPTAIAEMAAGLPPPAGLGNNSGATGVGCKRYAKDDEGIAPGSVTPRGVVLGKGPAGGGEGVRRRRRRCAGGMLTAPTAPPTLVEGEGENGGAKGVGPEEAVLLKGMLEGVTDLAGCEEALFRQVVMFM